MIGWLNPGALAGLALIGLPVIVHLLRTHHAERILFPSLRFVAVSRTASVRLHLPSDWLLLLVRTGIVAAAILAAAQPIVLTAARLRTWNERSARAVVVDASESMRLPDASGRAPAVAAGEAANAEILAAQWHLRLDAPVLRDAVVRASAWLATAPPARRELVVISNFRAGALSTEDLANVPAGIGLRFVRIDDAVADRVISGATLLGAPGVSTRVQEIHLTGPQTGVRLVEPTGDSHAGTASAASTERLRGLRIIGADPASASFERLWRTVAIAGSPAPSPDEPLVCQFGEGPIPDGAATAIGPATPGWMLRTVLRLREDQALIRMAREATTSGLAGSGVWAVVASDRRDAPIVRVAALGPALVAQVGAPADSLIAATALRAMLLARQGGAARPEQEILRLDAREVASWGRAAPPLRRDAWQHAERSDARWLWVFALALLVVEHRIRRGSAAAATTEVRHAA